MSKTDKEYLCIFAEPGGTFISPCCKYFILMSVTNGKIYQIK